MSLTKKAVYTTTLFTVFFLFYFLIQFLVRASEVEFLLRIDSLIPMIPEFIWLYWSLPIQIFLVMVCFIRDKNLFFKTFWSCIISSFLMFCFYLAFPSSYPREVCAAVDISSQLLELTRSIDAAHNTFPSSHVTFTWLMYLATTKTKLARRMPSLSLLSLLWTAGITFSTLAVKQHFVMDVIFGCLLAFTIFHFVIRFREYLHSITLLIYRGQAENS